MNPALVDMLCIQGGIAAVVVAAMVALLRDLFK